jgi:hypothetical protein
MKNVLAPCHFVGAEVMGHLARMKQQLQSERRRVESDLNREKVNKSVYMCEHAMCFFFLFL